MSEASTRTGEPVPPTPRITSLKAEQKQALADALLRAFDRASLTHTLTYLPAR